MGTTDRSHDVGALRRCISDVVALSTLSAVWAGVPRQKIAEDLARVLQETLGADVVYVGLRASDHAAACESACLRSSSDTALREAIREDVAPWLRQPGPDHRLPQISAGPRVVPLITPIGIHAEHGVVVTVARRDEFPSETDELVLNIAANQATLALLTVRARYLYAEAQRANTEKDQFLATLSHELRTPLNAITGWLSMLRRPEVMSSTGLPKAWTAIDRSAAALTDLVEDLLDVSRIATGKIRLADTDVDLNEIVRDSARTIEPKFMEKDVALSVDLHPQPCGVRGDPARLRQVTSNLLSNAVKFTASGGRVHVSVSCEETGIVLVVQDTGIGIHPDFLPHVFERFRQGGSDSAAGLGLGLAIVKNLVELHGGTVLAASDGIGRGARFTVTLPRRPHAAS